MNSVQENARWLAKSLAEGKKAVAALSQPQLATSSIEAGKIEEYDVEGTLMSVVGEQYDGTHTAATLAGPVPPEPVAASVVVASGQVSVRWSGKFVDDAVSPMDFSHVSVHIGEGEIFEPDNTTQKATISGESGDLVTLVTEPGEWSVILVAVSRAGKWSDPSDPVYFEVDDVFSYDDVLEGFLEVDASLTAMDEKWGGVIADAAQLGAKLTQAELDIIAHGIRLAANDAAMGTLKDVTLPALDTSLAAAKDRLQIAENTLAPLPAKVATAQSDLTAAFGQLNTVDSRIGTAKAQAAIDAQAKADAALAAASTDATAKAGQAKTDAIASATTMTNGIGKNLSSTAAPTTSNTAPKGSVWRRTDASGRIIGVWEQTGTAVAGVWTPRLITSDVVDNLDVGKLSASGAAINTAVISKLAVQIATIIELNADRITAGAITAGRIDTANLATALATILQLDAGVINSGTINTARLNVIAIAAATAAFQTVDVKNLFATSGTMAEAVITKLWTEVVNSRKITTNMLAVGSFDNAISEPDFTNGGASWGTNANLKIIAGAGRSGGPVLRMTGLAGINSSYNVPLDRPITGGTAWRVKAWVKPSVNVAADTFTIFAKAAPVTGTILYPAITPVVPALTAGQWKEVSGVIVTASTAAFASFALSLRASFPTGATLDIDFVSATRMSGGELLVDGAIDGTTIRGVQVIGSEVLTSDTPGELTARMGSTAIYFGGTVRPGIGFNKVTTPFSRQAGMYTTNGSDVHITQGGNTEGEAMLDLHDRQARLYAADHATVTARGSVTLDAYGISGEDGEVQIQGRYINIEGYVKVNDVPIMLETPWVRLSNASGWSDYVGGGGYRGGIWARKMGNNVQIVGMVKSGSGLMATLPVGLAPTYSAMYPAIAAAGNCGIVISNEGKISYLYGPTSPIYVNITLTVPLS